MSILDFIDLGISIVFILLIVGFVIFRVKNKIAWIILIAEFIFTIVFYFTNLFLCFYIALSISAVTLLIILFINLSEIRSLLATRPTKYISKFGKKDLPTEEDLAKFSKNIGVAVRWLADNKTGAIMTFERHDNLDKVIADGNGTIINCPVTPEIIETIFYEGTRLHDGAIVIRGTTIVAASVFFKSTTKTLIGKYGARHRAALGISEYTDSFTVIVSEETGRISIAYNGALESVNYDDFDKVFNTFTQTKENYIVKIDDEDRNEFEENHEEGNY